jgi:hypothetical protein
MDKFAKYRERLVEVRKDMPRVTLREAQEQAKRLMTAKKKR